MKYHIVITRTLTYEADIEAQGESDAIEKTEELEAALDNHEFELETTWEVSRPLVLNQGEAK